MTDKTYVLYLEQLIEALLQERGHEGDLTALNFFGEPPCTFSIYNIREAIKNKREERLIPKTLRE